MRTKMAVAWNWRATHKASRRDPADEKGFWATAHAKAFHDRKEWLDLIDHRLSNLTPAEHQN
ncbi:MAG TPA: hypothetical protein VHQ90_23290 [Thermoanaerobaculia bacterium]|nr:hypothetical protein [Thermoanaerobaculia bacterium]